MDRNEFKGYSRQENSPSLNSLPPDFYNRVNDYIHELEEEIRKINNPRSVESKILEDELQAALNDVETIFIRRIRKITSRATSNAFLEVSSSEDMSKLLPSEKKVYKAILSAIQTAREELIDPIFKPNTSKPSPSLNENEGEKKESDGNVIREQDNFEEATMQPEESNQISKKDINEEYCLVRILKDLPTFKAADDHNYTLAAEDIVVLPALNAKGLVKRGVAIPVEGRRIKLKDVRL
ncbi:hypothetical protein [Methanohalophilus sp.]|uniref:hypothetical protein n=1 Tax=Methanohalophilus sp. TaxID=1966352 RepID=UPI00262B7FA7|nr:hypothetical protein [Methanohalophilus sp.]